MSKENKKNEAVKKEEIKKLKKKKRQTLRAEQKDLQDRQAFLRQNRDILSGKLEKLRDAKYAAQKKKDDDLINIIAEQIKDVESDINLVTTEYKINTESLENYSKVLSNKNGDTNGLINALAAVAGTGAAIVLGKKSLDKAYEANIEGKLINKGPLEFFRSLNPLKMITRR